MMSRQVRIGLVLAAFALILTACSGASAASEQTVVVSPVHSVTVAVTLSEGAGGMKIESALTSFEVGVPYRFVVTNKGVLGHEFMIMPSMATASAVPMTMEELDEMALAVIEEDDLTPGATQEVTVTFDEPASLGTIEFACHVPGHYEGGMRLPIAVQ